MKSARLAAGAVAGLLVLDLLLNLPGISAGSVAASLLVPSIDLLVVGAILFMAAQSPAGARRTLRMVAVAVLLVLACYEVASRFGVASPAALFGTGTAARVASCAVSLVILAAGFVAAWLAAGLVLRGIETPVLRNGFIALVALVAIVHVVSGGRVLAQSVVPRMVRDIAALIA